ncbi:hypothetical protein BU14_2880s0001, partial [Porphyra umbilicalis]
MGVGRCLLGWVARRACRVGRLGRGRLGGRATGGGPRPWRPCAPVDAASRGFVPAGQAQWVTNGGGRRILPARHCSWPGCARGAPAHVRRVAARCVERARHTLYFKKVLLKQFSLALTHTGGAPDRRWVCGNGRSLPLGGADAGGETGCVGGSVPRAASQWHGRCRDVRAALGVCRTPRPPPVLRGRRHPNVALGGGHRPRRWRLRVRGAWAADGARHLPSPHRRHTPPRGAPRVPRRRALTGPASGSGAPAAAAPRRYDRHARPHAAAAGGADRRAACRGGRRRRRRPAGGAHTAATAGVGGGDPSPTVKRPTVSMRAVLFDEAPLCGR